MTTLSIDYETASEAPLTGASSVGLHNYMRHKSTRALMLAWSWNDGRVQQVDFTQGQTLPPDVREALGDPAVEKWGYNVQFERDATKVLLGIKTSVVNWRCSMALAYMRSFTGRLDEVGAQLNMEGSKVKDPMGGKLIRMFCQPQKPTRNQPHVWRGMDTDPEEWESFLGYNRQDVIAETAIKRKLLLYPVLDEEWRLYEIDQIINDRGLPVALDYVESAILMVARRKAELTDMMTELTGLPNPNSRQQLLPWMTERGYPFQDLQKLTIKKVLAEDKENPQLDGALVAALKLRQQASRTSVKKYDAIVRRLAPDLRLRHCFQFAGAGRTNRWSGRGPQPQNLVQTPKVLQREGGDFAKLRAVTEAIRARDYDGLDLMVAEPMDALAGCLRSSFQTGPDQEFVVCDLSAIESAVIAWLSGCKRLLRVFADGRDPYLDFGTELYKIAYELLDKIQRGICKPAVLGCGFGLGGGMIRNGKKTGLWGYADNMGVVITQAEAARQVAVFRATYPEIPEFWRKLEQACRKVVLGNQTVTVNGLLTLFKRGEYMIMRLPSGREMYYHKPRIMAVEMEGKNGVPYTREVFTCMGKSQVTHKWQRVQSGGPKLCENAVQGTARDILAVGVRRSHDYGFPIVGTVHDEIIATVRRGSNRLTLPALRNCMVAPIPWASGLPLKAAGYVSDLYMKD